MITIKSRKEFEKMAVAGQTVAVVLETVKRAAGPGVSLKELDAIAAEVIRSRGCTPSFLGYHGYPASICTSPNSVIVHGIPSDYRLIEGDVLSVDAGAIFEGFHGDAAITFSVGEVPPEVKLLIDTTERALTAGIAQVKSGARLGDIGYAVETEAHRHGFGVVREYVGHGIGRQMHEDPQVPNYGKPGMGTKIRKGMAICIEPMFNLGGHETAVEPDGWTVVTADGSLSAHFEHTIAVTDRGPKITTLLAAAEDDLAVTPASG
ncbi:MAG: type I methionyl aminopeptidase [Acidimicrobiia bacterium]|nr:type I methionyl aminopeptidase [Acidimicrobiia bacterium]MDH3396845.1 type I methionyl aminopeptidase [Acidimicrobiia bacterium]